MGLIIISKNAILRDAIRQLCETRNMLVSGLFCSCQDLKSTSVGQVMLVHVEADDVSPPEKVALLLQSFDAARFVILVQSGFVETIENSYGNRIAATISDSVSAETLVSALVLVMGGYSARKTTLPAEIEESPLPLHAKTEKSSENEAESPSFAPGALALSEREMAVMAYLRSGYSNKAIGRALGIQDSTVKAHLRSSFRRIGATNRTQAAMWAMQYLPHVPAAHDNDVAGLK